MITLTRRCLPFFLLFLLFSLSPSRLPAQTDKVTTTPFLLQQGFGPGGSLLPGDGANYCQPTSIASSLLWLHDNGYDRLFEQPFASESTNHANLVRALGGLMRTSARGGTSGFYAKAGLETYLGLKGYAGFGVTDYVSGYYDPASEMDLDFLQEQNTGYNVVNLTYRWGLTRDGADQDVGGHAVTLLKSDPAASELVIGNPAPFVKGGNPETHPVQSISFAGQENVLAIDFSSAIPRAQVWGILASAIVVSPDELPGGGGAATPWVLDTDQWINTNGAYLTAEAPITGSGALIKADFGDANGTLVLEAGVGGLEDPYTFTGGVWVQAGSLVAREDGPHPLGTGKIEISGGFLDLAPVGSGQDLSLSLAGGSGSTFTFSGGGGLVLDRGDHTSVESTLGGHTDGLSPNFIRSGRGTLMLIPASGMAGLGNSERIKVAGTGGNLPQPVNTILTPHVVAADPTRAYDGSFVAYDTTSGFLPHAGTDNAGVSLGAMDAAMVADVTVSESLSGANAVYALRIGEGVEVSGPGSLAVGSGAEGQAGGLILNGGRLTASGGLAFGEAEGVIYTGSRGGRIDAPITSAAGVIYFGPGQVEVSAANSYGGETLVQDGHLQVRNTSGSATGNGTVTLTRNGVLSGDGTISGNVQVDGIVAPGLFGPTGYTPAALTFEADADFRTDSIFSWTLVSLTDGPLGGVAGEDWSFLSVGGGISFSEDAYLELNFADIAGPESGDPFWSEERMWSFASYDTLNGLENLSVFGDDLEYGDFRIQPDLDNRLLNLEFIPGLGVIPEPSTFALLVTAMMLGAMARHCARAAGPDPTRHAAIPHRYRVRT